MKNKFIVKSLLAIFQLSALSLASNHQMLVNKAKELDVSALFGNVLNINEYKNDQSWFIVNIWATWCVPCINEIEELNYFYNRYQSKINVIGITYEKITKQELRSFIEDSLGLNIRYRFMISSAVSEQLAPFLDQGIPQTYIFNAQGMLVKRHLGEITNELLEFYLDELSFNTNE